MRMKHVVARFSGFRDPALAVPALVFLHALSDERTGGRPPRDACWQRILKRPQEEWGQGLDAACRACLETWPEQLAGFFGDLSFAGEPARALEPAIEGIERLAAEAHRRGGPWDGRTLLADVSQELRSLGAKQWQGAFFTPWSVAEAMARIALDGARAQELWILEPYIGGATMLVAALEVYRERHGLRNSRAVTLIGVDINPRVCQIARASLLLAGADPRQFWVFHGNSLSQPILGRDRRDGRLKALHFHSVLTNPPFDKTTAAREFARDAERGPLVVPDHVLNRRIPRVAQVGAASPGGTPSVRSA
jgi:hypothetical protein